MALAPHGALVTRGTIGVLIKTCSCTRALCGAVVTPVTRSMHAEAKGKAYDLYPGDTLCEPRRDAPSHPAHVSCHCNACARRHHLHFPVVVCTVAPGQHTCTCRCGTQHADAHNLASTRATHVPVRLLTTCILHLHTPPARARARVRTARAPKFAARHTCQLVALGPLAVAT